MSHSWDDYYSNYSDWDDSHCFNVRIELKYEDNLKQLGYIQYVNDVDYLSSETNFLSKTLPNSKTYIKNDNQITLSFEVPYDWSIDTDWEDKALILLGLRDEWVIDSSVEDK